jgi:hypothetical protein
MYVSFSQSFTVCDELYYAVVCGTAASGVEVKNVEGSYNSMGIKVAGCKTNGR